MCHLAFQNPFPHNAIVQGCADLTSEWELDPGTSGALLSADKTLAKFASTELSIIYKPTPDGPVCSEVEFSICCFCPETREDAKYRYKITGEHEGIHLRDVGQRHVFATQAGLKSARVFTLKLPPKRSFEGPCTVCLDPLGGNILEGIAVKVC